LCAARVPDSIRGSIGASIFTTRRTLFAAAIVPLRRHARHISLGQIAGKRGGIAPAWIAATAPARALQQEAFAGAHLEAARGRGPVRAGGPEPDHDARAAPRLPPLGAAGGKAAFVVAANDGGAPKSLVSALGPHPAAPFSGPAGIGDKLETGDAAGKL